jgi:hypothetical protein
MQTVEIEGKDFVYPGSWNEMNRAQLLDIARLLQQQLSPYDLKVRLIFKWLRLNKCLFHYRDATWIINGIYRLGVPFAMWGIKKGRVKSIDYSDVARLAETLDFLLTEEPLPDGRIRVERNNALTRQMIPMIKAGVRLYGPDDRMRNITAGEFAKAEYRYQSFLASGNVRYLNEMIAVLYRPARRFAWLARLVQSWDGEHRVSYHDYHLARATDIDKINMDVRFAILMFFEGCRNLAISGHPHVFNSNGDGGGEDSTGWAGIFQAISDKPTDIEQIARLNFWTLLFDLEQKAIANERQRNELENKK